MPLLSVIIPVYNEARTLEQILERVTSVEIDKEIIVVDDGSCDGTDSILRKARYRNLKVIHHSHNRGKGAAFLTGLSHATGELVIIQDADLEYNPQDYLKLVGEIKGDNADLVLGVRFRKGYQGLFMHRLGNRVLTAILNLLFDCRLNDYLTCYKLARRSILNDFDLQGMRFDIDTEIICKALRQKQRITEVSISYYPRSYREGKKIRLKDAFWAIFYMLKYRLAS